MYKAHYIMYKANHSKSYIYIYVFILIWGASLSFTLQPRPLVPRHPGRTASPPACSLKAEESTADTVEPIVRVTR